MGELEKRIRKLRRDFFIASGFEKMESNAVLVMSKDVWEKYLEENKNIKTELPSNLNKVTFEYVIIKILEDKPEVKDLICYLPIDKVKFDV